MQPESLGFQIDLNLSPIMVLWLTEGFSIVAKSFKELGFEQTQDVDVYKMASPNINTIITTTKDIDFINYKDETGAPPKILYINVGDLSNENLKIII